MTSQDRTFVLCVNNEDHPASLELRKVYEVVRDEDAAERGMIRVVDESGEDYLYPEHFFVPVELSQAAAELFARAS